jgi:8-oxo-dGTP pyrophosphatase MutT (NUDIX family)
MTPAAIRQQLARYLVRPLPLGHLRPASVLVPLRFHQDQPWLILTRRSSHLPCHGGEIAFPGGGVDPGDSDDWQTALRETGEELGIETGAIEPLGQLDDCYSIHHYRVSCHVGLIPAGMEFTPEPGEIEALIELPLKALNNPAIYHQEDWQHRGRPVPVDFYHLDGHQIWGMTGGILKQLLARLGPLLE